MTYEKKYFVTHSAGNILCDHISREKNDGTYEHLSYQDIVDELNKLNDENEELCNFNIHGLQVVEEDVETPLLVVPTELFNKLKKDVGGFMND